MSFFDKRKGKKKDEGSPKEPTDKASFSLFKKSAEPVKTETQAGGRFLTLIRGKGVQQSSPEEDLEVPEQPAAQQTAEPTEPVRALSLSRKEPTLKQRPSAQEAPDKDLSPASQNNPPPTQKQTVVSNAPAGMLTPAEPAVKASRKLFNRASKKNSELTEGSSAKKAANKPAKARKGSSRAVLGASKDFHLYAQLENGKDFFWAITANHIQEVDRKKVLRAASFSREDHAIRAPKGLRHKAAYDLALQELGEPVHIVNRSKDLLSVYATSEERALTTSFRIFPGQQALDKLVKDARVSGKSVIGGFTFNTQDGRTALLVLYHITPEGLTTKPQITLNPDNMEFVLQQFATSRKINKKDAEILLFSNADFLGQVNGLQAYPDERVWRGVPVSALARAAVLVSMVGAGSLSAWAATGYTQLTLMQQTVASLKERMDQHRKESSTLISGSLYGFSTVMSLNTEQAFTQAQGMWQQGSKVALIADLSQNKYTVKIPVVFNKRFNNRPSVNSTPAPDEVDKVLNIVPPEGCTKDTTSVSGNLNEIQVTVVCTTSDSGLSGFRND